MTFVPIQNLPQVTKGSEHDFTYYTQNFKVPYMCMICRVCISHTDRNRFLHLSEGENDKFLRQILRNFSRYFIFYNCQLHFISCTVSDRLISNVVCCRLLSVNSLNSSVLFWKKLKSKKMNRPDCRTDIGLYTDKTILYIAQRRIMRWVNLRGLQRMCR